MRNRDGFALIQLVTIVGLVAIFGTVAVPEISAYQQYRTDQSLRQALTEVRGAIKQYYSANHALPGDEGTETDFKADLAPYLSHFPRSPLEGNPTDVLVVPESLSDFAIGGDAAWVYSSSTGHFMANSEELSGYGAVTYDQF